jgi:hypothetical protein
MTHRIRFTSPEQVFEAFPSAAEEIEIRPKSETPLEFARKLLAAGRRFESVVYLACLLPRREAIWWGIRCFQTIHPQGHDDALAAAEAWVRDPSEATRRAALSLGWSHNPRKATTWLALAAGQSGGSIAAEHAPAVPASPQATAVAVKAAIILAITRASPPSQRAWLAACVEAGIRFADGGNAELKSPAPATAKPAQGNSRLAA